MSDYTWWTPARRKMYGRQTPNGITCQSCGHDVCQCEPRTATIGEHVDAVMAAKDAEIERLRVVERAAELQRVIVEAAYQDKAQAERERDDWHTLADARSAEIVRVMGELDEARALLRELSDDGPCPCCDFGEGVHDIGCRLAAIALKEEVRGE